MAHAFNNENFEKEVKQASKPVLVDFWAEWCGPCMKLAPTIDALSKERDDIIIGKVNIEECPDLAAEYRVQGIPFMAIFHEGKVVSTQVGLQPKANLEEWIEETVKKIK